MNVAVEGVKELKIESLEVDDEGYATIVLGFKTPDGAADTVQQELWYWTKAEIVKGRSRTAYDCGAR